MLRDAFSMRPRSIRPQASICQLCDFLSPRLAATSPPIRRISLSNKRQATATQRHATQRPRPSSDINATPQKRRSLEPVQSGTAIGSTQQVSQAQIDEKLGEVRQVRDSILSSTSLPSEKDVQRVFKYCEAAADILIVPADQKPGKKNVSATTALLEVVQRTNTKAKLDDGNVFIAIQKAIDELSEIAFSILIYPPVFITPDILKRYVDFQSRLGKPESFPEVFCLFAEKPVPEEGSWPIKYDKPNPHKVANAINSAVADRALESAIERKRLVTALDIVDTTYNTKAFRNAKFLRRGLVPATGLALAPVAAFTLASQLSIYQNTMDPAMATNLAFVGMLAYVGFTATVGIVAVTTANDHMDRVTWAVGLPLRDRWIREEERAAIDRIAGAWGFREAWRRGEEEGEDWDALKEWIGRRGMVLDRVELMEGME